MSLSQQSESVWSHLKLHNQIPRNWRGGMGRVKYGRRERERHPRVYSWVDQVGHYCGQTECYHFRSCIEHILELPTARLESRVFFQQFLPALWPKFVPWGVPLYFQVYSCVRVGSGFLQGSQVAVPETQGNTRCSWGKVLSGYTCSQQSWAGKMQGQTLKVCNTTLERSNVLFCLMQIGLQFSLILRVRIYVFFFLGGKMNSSFNCFSSKAQSSSCNFSIVIYF